MPDYESRAIFLQDQWPQCPKCGKVNSSHGTDGGRRIPIPGDLSLCAYCLALNEFVFTPGPTGAVISLKEVDEAALIAADPELGPALIGMRDELRRDPPPPYEDPEP